MAPSSSSSPSDSLNDINSSVFQNPLSLHPSDGPGSLCVQDKLLGAQNYRSWKRSIEIALSTKRKLGFIRGIVLRSLDDAALQEQWDTCNNMVISWLMISVSESIAKSIMFVVLRHNLVGKAFNVFLKALQTQKKEQRLFQFLNGLDDTFTSQRSQMLLMSPLPTVESACALLQQEESQRGVFGSSNQLGIQTTALYRKNETKENPNRRARGSQQVQILHPKGLQLQWKVNLNKGGDSDEELDHYFTAGIYFFSTINGVIWTLDTRCIDHMTPVFNDLFDLRDLQYQQLINLPNGQTSTISQIGNLTLQNDLPLKDVLVVPSFKFSLLSVSKLTKDSNCFVTFYSEFCVIQDLVTKKVLGMGKKQAGLYHLLNIPLDQIHQQRFAMVISALEDCSLYSFFANSMPNKSAFSVFNNSYSLWHHRLGHVSDSTLKHIPCIPQSSKSHTDTCLSCPMAKYTKLLYATSDSHWGDCVVIATYLINRFPSVVLGNKTPYEILMNKKLSYSNLKVFGCLAVASNPSRVIDKMAPRGVPCLFLGYPPHQKGYTLINLLTHTRFVSRDVTFYERIFPYSKSSMSGVRSS
ncbi:cysteine-rich receptor-like protein kinase 8 [Tanacetum coccineum]